MAILNPKKSPGLSGVVSACANTSSQLVMTLPTGLSAALSITCFVVFSHLIHDRITLVAFILNRSLKRSDGAATTCRSDGNAMLMRPGNCWSDKLPPEANSSRQVMAPSV